MSASLAPPLPTRDQLGPFELFEVTAQDASGPDASVFTRPTLID